jgi:hypothetical protein|tara:strand:+ start:194 stop:466 length:273 start_codon:yes stop_codon:yes gene_type:complete
MISVTMVEANVYEVVLEGQDRDQFRVLMSQEYYRELCGLTVTHEWLIIQAFTLLMDQEAWQDQLSGEFDLAELSNRYPQFNRLLKEKLLA